MTLKPEELHKVAALLLRCASTIASSGALAVTVARDFSAEGAKPAPLAGGQGRGSGISDPTGQTATQPRPSILTELEQQAGAVVREVGHLEHLIVMLTRPPKRGTPDVPLCANCNELALPRPRSGRCEACYRHRARTGQDRQLPTRNHQERDQ